MAARTSILELGEAVKDSECRCWLIIKFQMFSSSQWHCIHSELSSFFFSSLASGKEVKHSPCIHSNFKDSWKFGITHNIDIGLV